jgi:hypothetical protein
MPVIKLTHNDLSEMVRRTVYSVLSESVKEAMGSAMAGKEDVIEELVNYIANEWEKIKASGQKPESVGSFSAKVGNGRGEIKNYIILVPNELAKKLDIADKFDLNVAVNDYQVPQNILSLFGNSERGTEGSTYHGKSDNGDFYGTFSKPTLKIKHSRIDLIVPAINGELQTNGLYSTLYHELNHSFTALNIKLKKNGKTDKKGNEINLDDLNPISASKRAKHSPHFMVQGALHPDPISDFITAMDYGPDKEYYRMISFLFYAVWETTERNARAEEMYGSLQALKAKRENFKAIYPQTTVYQNLKQYNELLDTLKKVPDTSKIWSYTAEVMNMKPLSSRRKNNPKSFHQNVKERFIKHTEELFDKLYRKAMKVAELYFQRQEEKEREKADRPGGGLERLNQLIDND